MLVSRRGVMARRSSGFAPQSAAPDASLDTTNWSIVGGSATHHAALADDSDATYLAQGVNSAQTLRVSLASLTDPARSTGHVIRIRAASSNGTGSIRVGLWEGSNARKALTDVGALSTTVTAYAVTLSGAEADSITDYSNLELRVEGTPAFLQNVQLMRARFDLD